MAELKVHELATFAPIPKAPDESIHVRVVRWNSRPRAVLDVRPYITSARYTGYSPKGISLTLAQAEALAAQMPAILETLRAQQPKAA
jgi:hypothetical protein